MVSKAMGTGTNQDQGKQCRILSLDGGGTWALIQAMALERLYPGKTGLEILGQFDFAFANSGGSIVLAGLLLDWTPRRIREQFTDPANVSEMYYPAKVPIWQKILRRKFEIGIRYSTEAKANHLRKLIGESIELDTVSHSNGRQTYIVIVAYDYDRGRTVFFRSRTSLRTGSVEMRLHEAVHASSTAPVNFYDSPAEVRVQIDNGDHRVLRCLDGALTGLNNPAAAALAEAISVGNLAENIAVLSLGTGGKALPSDRIDRTVHPAYVASPRDVSFTEQVKSTASSILDDPPDFASFLAHAMLGGQTPAPGAAQPCGSNIVRMSPLLTPKWDSHHGWSAPDVLGDLRFRSLLRMEMSVTSRQDIAALQNFAAAWMQDQLPNQPIRFHFRDPTRGLVPEIGYDTFSAAKARWDTLAPWRR